MDWQQAKQQTYPQHLKKLLALYQQLLDQNGYEGVLIHSGQGENFFRDDQQKPSRINPYFLHWLPLDQHLDCFLWLKQGECPILFYYRSNDFWHQAAEDPAGYWLGFFDVIEIDNLDSVAATVCQHKDLAFIGEASELAARFGIHEVNPQPMLAALDWYRAVKSDYERCCLEHASALAVVGHQAVKTAFDGGASEFEMQMSYLQATGQREHQLPYGNIIALNQHAAILHYQHYQQQRPETVRSLLIDAGARIDGYGSDITRTYASQPGVFADLVQELDRLQQQLISEIKVSVSFVDLHRRMCELIAGLLQRSGLVAAEPQSQMEQGIVTAFFPHGLGHLLGLQVHDCAGQQSDSLGTPAPPPEAFPHLRLTRALEAGMVFTIEPGIYFIDQLLQPLRTGSAADLINWSMVDALRPCGGIRIEDNIYLSPTQVKNLTREAFNAGHQTV
ncbi:MAG: Xaa-Pro dipeptidase [Motiliproteus sp.]|nr:Xaa-Pro dipeptidase [Motiliproteus sp.]MCW9053813.1 Xaa-Pro dipeptidase [Motiliproteus sp.]